MKILALESSAKAASVAICDDTRLISQYFQASGLTHSRTLLVMAEDILKNAEMTIDDIDAIAVAKGPGSFTGIRIGVAAAKGLAWASEKPLVGVSTLLSMAYHLVDCEDAVISPVMDARRSQIYNAKFISDGKTLERITPDRAIAMDELIAEAEKDKKKYLFVGDGAIMCYNAFLEKGLDARLPSEPLLLQSAWGVACAALSDEAEYGTDIVPEYLRLSQAERERLEKLQRRKDNE